LKKKKKRSKIYWWFKRRTSQKQKKKKRKKKKSIVNSLGLILLPKTSSPNNRIPKKDWRKKGGATENGEFEKPKGSRAA